MEAASQTKKHVVLFSFPGQGHLNSFLTVAGLLRRELPDSTVITIVCTPRNIAALRSSSEPSSNIGFHALPFVPADHGLPPDCESTTSLPASEFITLFKALDSLEPAFDAYISLLRREHDGAAADVCVVSDVFLAWTVDVAHRHGCAHALYASCSAFGTAVLHALWRHAPSLPLAADGATLRLPEIPEVTLNRSQLTPSLVLGDERWAAYHHRLLPLGDRTDAVLVNTAEELESAGLALLRRCLGSGKVPVFPIGPLVRTSTSESDADSDRVLWWLDTQSPSSVLYVSFGSQNTIRPNQMMELAAALEATGRPFVWAVRPPVGFGITSPEEWLPDGFEARAQGDNRGLVVRGWAPQLRVLAHRATGAFLSHGGWNSVVESLAHGVPVIGWPLAGEQFYNVKMLVEEWGVGVEAARGNMEDSVVERAKVVEAVETVMGNAPESAAIRQRVAEVREVLRKSRAEDGGSSRAALQDFFRAMKLQ